MVGIDFDKKPFLNGEQTDLLGEISAAAEDMDTNLSLSPLFRIVPRLINLAPYMSKENDRLRKLDPNEPHVIEDNFRLSGFRAVTYDTVKSVMITSVAILTGEAVTKERTEDAARGQSLSETLIAQKMKASATELLLGGLTLHYLYTGLGDTQSTWEWANAAHASALEVKPPVRINTEEGEAFGRLLGRAELYRELESEFPTKTPFKVTNSKLGNLFRATRFTISSLRGRGFGMAGFGYMTEIIPSMGMDLTAHDASRAIRTASKQAKYIRSGAQIDNELANDPKARYMVFLGDNLGHIDEASERSRFRKKVQDMVTKSQAKLLQADE